MTEQKQDAGTPARNRRKVRTGVVTSDKMTRTVTVKLERQVAHPVYGKRMLRTSKFHARDDLGAKTGDKVRIMETRPLSKLVRWRVTEILERAK